MLRSGSEDPHRRERKFLLFFSPVTEVYVQQVYSCEEQLNIVMVSLIQKFVGVNKNSGSKICSSQKKIWFKNLFGSKQILVKKFVQVKQKFGSKKNSGQNKF